MFLLWEVGAGQIIHLESLAVLQCLHCRQYCGSCAIIFLRKSKILVFTILRFLRVCLPEDITDDKFILLICAPSWCSFTLLVHSCCTCVWLIECYKTVSKKCKNSTLHTYRPFHSNMACFMDLVWALFSIWRYSVCKECSLTLVIKIDLLFFNHAFFYSYPLLKLPLPGTGPVEFTTGVRDYSVPSHESQGDVSEHPDWVKWNSCLKIALLLFK